MEFVALRNYVLKKRHGCNFIQEKRFEDLKDGFMNLKIVNKFCSELVHV